MEIAKLDWATTTAAFTSLPWSSHSSSHDHDQHSSSLAEALDVVHIIAQTAHCVAQGKVGR